jgi:hypothetical protein
VTDATKLIRANPVECVVKVRKLRLRRKAEASIVIESCYGGPAFNLIINIVVTPDDVRFKGGLLTTKTDQVLLDDEEIRLVLSLPSLELAMDEIRGIAAGR